MILYANVTVGDSEEKISAKTNVPYKKTAFNQKGSLEPLICINKAEKDYQGKTITGVFDMNTHFKSLTFLGSKEDYKC